MMHTHWTDVSLPGYPTLNGDLTVDVVVVGGGLTGITTAYLLKQAGISVALLERDRLAGGDTARTTAHLTYVTDYRLHELAKSFGNEAAKAFWEAGRTAIDEIARLADETGADCDFKRVPGYLHLPAGERGPDASKRLSADFTLARQFGFAAETVDRVPYALEPGIRFSGQAKFHPRKYLSALASAIPGKGSHVFEHTAFQEVREKPLAVIANDKRISCNYLVIATHNPLMGKSGVVSATLFQSKLALYTSYVLGAKVPPDTLPEALFWDTADPYDYLRVDAGVDCQYLIFGGEDIKTGQEKDPEDIFRKLEGRLRARLPMAQVTDRWLGQVVETDDGLPFIGENAEQEFIATGFCGNGFTLGTVAALLARDRCLGRKPPWLDLFKTGRAPIHGGLWRYLAENADYPYYFLRDRLAAASSGNSASLQCGEGRVVDHEGHRAAAFKDFAGNITLRSPICTHMKCLVRWNAADRTWDCPCHGSRFQPTGEVLSGPAESPLEPLPPQR